MEYCSSIHCKKALTEITYFVIKEDSEHKFCSKQCARRFMYNVERFGELNTPRLCPVCELKVQPGEFVVMAPIQIKGWEPIEVIPVHEDCVWFGDEK